MITAAKLTRTALELGVPADVFSETASNLRAIDNRIVLAFVDANAMTQWTSVEQIQASYKKFRAEHIQALLED